VSRIVVYAQHLSGVGHRVRTDLLARGLARTHAVWTVDGGMPVPRPGTDDRVRPIVLPRLGRDGDRLVAVEPSGGTSAASVRGGDLAGVLAARTGTLAAAVAAIRPDVVIVEHFPFSKWELAEEIFGLIDGARAANAQVRVVSSIRDVVWKTRFDPGDEDAHAARVVATLNDRFDALLVHSDPRLLRLVESFPRASEIRVPLVHTGFVVETPPVVATAAANGEASAPTLVASSGGGVEGLLLAHAVIEGFRLLRPHAPSLRLQLFGGLSFAPAQIEALTHEAAGLPARIAPFSADFLTTLAHATVSVSRAGYNTCMNLLATNVPAVLVPSAARSDQRLRAARLAERRIATVRMLLGRPAAPPPT